MRLSIDMATKIASSLASAVTLNDGIVMPMFGLGTWMASHSEGCDAIKFALQHGYKMVDTAEMYGNETMVGKGVNDSGVRREDVFVVTKFSNGQHGYDICTKTFHKSLKQLGTQYVDLYLIHAPIGGKLVETYDAMLELKKQGLIKSVGVSNFNIPHIEGLRKAGRPLPSVNQIELHCFLKQQKVVDYCVKMGIAVMAYCPIAEMDMSRHPPINAMAKRYKKTVPQLMIHWCVQKGYIPIPKSVKPHRIMENADIFNFTIQDDDMAEIEKFPEHRCDWNPLTVPWEG